MLVPQDTRFSEVNLKRIQKLPHEERVAKFNTLRDDLSKRLAKLKEAAAPPISVDEYLRSSASLDLTSDAAISSSMYHRPVAGVTPVPSGSHIDVCYFLLPRSETVPPVVSHSRWNPRKGLACYWNFPLPQDMRAVRTRLWSRLVMFGNGGRRLGSGG